MNLSLAQLQTLKAAIAANSATVTVGGTDFAISAVPKNGDGAQAVADWYSKAASPAYLVWNPSTGKAATDAQIVKANFTPTDSPPASTNNVQGTNDALLYNNRALSCQLKQTNAQWLTQGTGSIDATIASTRQNFKDCLLAIPSGASGANQDAGWGTAGSPGAVRMAMQRSALNIEKQFSVAGSGAGNAGGDARGGATNPDVFGLDADGAYIAGAVPATVIQAAWNS